MAASLAQTMQFHGFFDVGIDGSPAWCARAVRAPIAPARLHLVRALLKADQIPPAAPARTALIKEPQRAGKFLCKELKEWATTSHDAEATLARVSDGSNRARPVHVFRLCLHGVVVPPVIAAR